MVKHSGHVIDKVTEPHAKTQYAHCEVDTRGFNPRKKKWDFTQQTRQGALDRVFIDS